VHAGGGHDHDVIANFGLGDFQLTVSTAGAGGGRVTSMPAGIDCGALCTADFPYRTLVTLTAAADARSTFGGWAGACSGLGSCVVSMDRAKTVTATFNLRSYNLVVTRAGGGSGTVSSSPAGIMCGATCSTSFPIDTVVTLTAAPAMGSTFTGWSGACMGTGTCIVTMSADRNVTATFAVEVFTLTVNKNGTGTGTVRSMPAGIDCGATCMATFNSGTVVTLTPTADPGSTFVSWAGGGCGGMGACMSR